jgi:TetR/AcrR family transcriptional regulator, fatty acid metabolism regulator protein
MTRKNKYVSVQETRAQVTREKLLKAALKLVNQYGMKYLTVRNVCDAAGLSTGSFYNLFSGKDELIAYYLKHVFFTYKKEADTAGEHHSSIEKTLLIYRFYIQCCKEAGLEFVSALYSGNTNPSFNFLDRSPEEELVLDRVREYIEQGKEKGEIDKEVATDLILARIAIIVTGNVFYWCVFEGDYDLAYQVDDMLGKYLLSVAKDDSLTINLPPVEREGLFSDC